MRETEMSTIYGGKGAERGIVASNSTYKNQQNQFEAGHDTCFGQGVSPPSERATLPDNARLLAQCRTALTAGMGHLDGPQPVLGQRETDIHDSILPPSTKQTGSSPAAWPGRDKTQWSLRPSPGACSGGLVPRPTYRDNNFGALEGHHGHGRPPHIAGTDAADAKASQLGRWW